MTDPIQAAIKMLDGYCSEEACFPNAEGGNVCDGSIHVAIRSLASLVMQSRIAGMEWTANYFAVAARGYAEVPMDGFYKELERLRCLPKSRAEKP